jgi:hypothetical protein
MRARGAPARRARREDGEQRDRLADEDLGQDRHLVVAGEGVVAGQRLVEDAAEGEDVGGRPDVGLAAHLLGGHVARRADASPEGVTSRPPCPCAAMPKSSTLTRSGLPPTR